MNMAPLLTCIRIASFTLHIQVVSLRSRPSDEAAVSCFREERSSFGERVSQFRAS